MIATHNEFACEYCITITGTGQWNVITDLILVVVDGHRWNLLQPPRYPTFLEKLGDCKILRRKRGFLCPSLDK